MRKMSKKAKVVRDLRKMQINVVNILSDTLYKVDKSKIEAFSDTSVLSSIPESDIIEELIHTTFILSSTNDIVITPVTSECLSLFINTIINNILGIFIKTILPKNKTNGDELYNIHKLFKSVLNNSMMCAESRDEEKINKVKKDMYIKLITIIIEVLYMVENDNYDIDFITNESFSIEYDEEYEDFIVKVKDDIFHINSINNILAEMGLGIVIDIDKKIENEDNTMDDAKYNMSAEDFFKRFDEACKLLLNIDIPDEDISKYYPTQKDNDTSVDFKEPSTIDILSQLYNDDILTDMQSVAIYKLIKDDDDKLRKDLLDNDAIVKLNRLRSLISDMRDNSDNIVYLRLIESLLSNQSSSINNKIDILSRKTIYCIVGESGSGKDSLIKYTLEKYKLPLKLLVSYTDRPKRPNETNGVEHWFVGSSDFTDIKNNDEVVAYTRIGEDGYRYMATRDNLEDSDIYLIDPEGLKGFKANYGHKYDIVTIYIDCPYKERYNRAVSKRGDSPCKFAKRYNDEQNMFKVFRQNRDYDYIIDNGDLTTIDDASMFLVKILTK